MKVIIGFGSLVQSLLPFIKEKESLYVFSRNVNKIIEQILKDIEKNEVQDENR